MRHRRARRGAWCRRRPRIPIRRSAAVGVGGVPVDVHDRRVRIERRPGCVGRGPVAQIARAGEHGGNAVASPLRLAREESGEIAIADRPCHQRERGHPHHAGVLLEAHGRTEIAALDAPVSAVRVAGDGERRCQREQQERGGRRRRPFHPILTCRPPAWLPGTRCRVAGPCRCRGSSVPPPSGCPASPCGTCGRCCGPPARSCRARRP